MLPFFMAVTITLDGTTIRDWPADNALDPLADVDLVVPGTGPAGDWVPTSTVGTGGDAAGKAAK